MVYAEAGCMCVFLWVIKNFALNVIYTRFNLHSSLRSIETMLEKLALLAVEILNSMNLNMLK